MESQAIKVRVPQKQPSFSSPGCMRDAHAEKTIGQRVHRIGQTKPVTG